MMGEEKVANHQKYVSIFKDSEGAEAHEVKNISIELPIPEEDDYRPPLKNVLPIFRS